MSLVSPSYLRYLSRFKREVVNLEHFEYVCDTIVQHTIMSINDTFKRHAARGETSARLSIRLGNVVSTQSIVEKAPSDIKGKVEEQMLFYTTESLREALKVYPKSAIEENADNSITITIEWGLLD